MTADNLNDKLRRFGHLIAEGKVQDSPSAASFSQRYYQLCQAVSGGLAERAGGAYCLVSHTYPFGFILGEERLVRPDSVRIGLDAFQVQETGQQIEISDLVFFDTETTGLGGSGAVAFLVGFGSLTPGGFEVRQYLLPDYSDETALLEDALEELRSDSVLVTYNGAAFDVPLLRDRMIINRVGREVPVRHHIDLLHAARRLYRRRLRDCSLTNIEREVFGFDRVDDVPGYLIPGVYFEWLSSDSTELLVPVLEHNRLDILSLYFLLHKLHLVHESEGASLDDTEDIHSLARVYARRKKHELAVQVGGRLSGARGAVTGDMLLFRAMECKRAGDWEAAVVIWRQLADTDYKEGYLANLELAKYLEHRQRDIPGALRAARKAWKLLPESRSQRHMLAARLKRLERKQQAQNS